MNHLADSEIIEEKADRASFRIHYKKGEDFKHYDFEARRSVAGIIFVLMLLDSQPRFGININGYGSNGNGWWRSNSKNLFALAHISYW